MKCKFSNFNEYNPHKRERGFKQRNKCKNQCKKHKLFFECKDNTIQRDCRIYDSKMHFISLKIQAKNTRNYTIEWIQRGHWIPTLAYIEGLKWGDPKRLVHFAHFVTVSVTVDFTTHGGSHIYGLPCPSTDSLDPMDHFCTFDVSKIIPKNTYYLLYTTFNPFLVYIREYYP